MSVYVDSDDQGDWDLVWAVDGRPRVVIPLELEEMRALAQRLLEIAEAEGY